MTAKVTVSCDGIMCGKQVVLDLPEGWIGEVSTNDGHWIYCAECAKTEKPFFAAQCPGCVSSFPNCGLAGAFMYDDASTREIMTPDKLKIIETGVCPFRVNGSLGVNMANGKVQFSNVDLSDVAPPECGQAIVKKIHEYIEQYPTRYQ